MDTSHNSYKTRARVIAGFVLALVLIVGVSMVTYFSVRKLLDTVEALAEPSERLRHLNGLLADIYQLDRAQGRVDQDTQNGSNYLQKIEERLLQLQEYASDSTEIDQLKKISYNVNELLLVHNGLDEVKFNLINRNFSSEALKNIETKIRRQEELNRLQTIGRIKLNQPTTRRALPDTTRRPEGDTLPPRRIRRDTTAGINELLSSEERANLRQLLSTLNINPARGDTTRARLNQSQSDSILYAVRSTILDINTEEQRLRSQLAALEFDLVEKNKIIIADIQTVISTLQQEVLAEARSQNDDAYELTFKVSILLIILIVIGVIGSTAFIYSILSEINKAQDYRLRLEEAKKRSDNLAKAKQYFLANMSHEIRNPLHAIQGYNEALKKTPLDDDQQSYVKMVGFASQTLSSIVNDILDLSKLEAGKITFHPEPFNPHLLFRNIKDFFELKIKEKGLEFVWDVDLPQDKWLVGDELRINQIMNNLISNAYKFTDKGIIKVDVSYDAGNLRLAVIDSGMGMTKEVRENIFTEFNQGDSSITRKFGGTGLGLSIVKKMVDLQEGEITFESELGSGTAFYVELPVPLTDAIEDSRDLNAQLTYSIEGVRVLLVDDDPIGIKFAKLLLESNGAKVSSYLGGVDFRDNFQKEPFDIALLDIQMPEVSGYQVLNLLKENYHYDQLPILAVTANVFADERDKLSNHGFDGILLKPFKENKLVETIASYLNLEPTKMEEKISNNDHSNSKYSLSDLEKFCMGDEELLQEVVQEFYEETVSNLRDIQQLADKEDYQAVMEIAHKLSSRLGQLRIDTAELAKNIEINVKQDDTSEVRAMVKGLVERTHVVLEEIQKKENISSAG
ncbi:response regulator [Litoribacter ruber]|uniref:histidine kinase n=1 Tax=Litoribacter ruber TaxID=702568 RepID=A0AAP2CKG1_9BACT|nr:MULTISPECIES: ATP-binding protein [Litoribacter]MBS9524891.1 response regulator [Litoribacter alkaliphilus]MBT0811948.1 response regulator [Litoribacter ruber]